MNPDLEEWLRDHPANDTKEPSTETKTGGVCAHCAAAASRRCLRCERPACSRHHHVMVGLCIRCQARDDPADADRTEDRDSAAGADPTADRFADERPRPHPGLDIDWVE